MSARTNHLLLLLMLLMAVIMWERIGTRAIVIYQSIYRDHKVINSSLAWQSLVSIETNLERSKH